MVETALAGSNVFAVKDVTVSFPEPEKGKGLVDVEEDSMVVEFVYYKSPFLYNGGKDGDVGLHVHSWPLEGRANQS